MKFLVLTLLSLTGFSAAAHSGHSHGPDHHLTFAQGTLHAHLSWTAGPALEEESSLLLEWRKGSDHSAIEPGREFKVYLWMPDMNHGSAPTVLVPANDAQGNRLPGAYNVGNVHFIMGGRWTVNVALKNADGTEEVKSFEVKLEDSEGHGPHHH